MKRLVSEWARRISANPCVNNDGSAVGVCVRLTGIDEKERLGVGGSNLREELVDANEFLAIVVTLLREMQGFTTVKEPVVLEVV